MIGYLRSDGRKGIRNVIVVAYLVECAHHVARRIVDLSADMDVHLIGFPGCYPNQYSLRMMKNLCVHPNVGGVLIVSLGCEGFNRKVLHEGIAASGRPVETLVIQERGGTASTMAAGVRAVAAMKECAAKTSRVAMGVEDLVIATVCGGSDGTSGLTANPAVGKCSLTDSLRSALPASSRRPAN